MELNVDISINLPQTIGTQSGVLKDGSLVGQAFQRSLAPEEIPSTTVAMGYFTKAHHITYASLFGYQVSDPDTTRWTMIEDNFADNTSTTLFAFNSGSPAYNYTTLYLAVPDLLTTSFTFNLTTAGVGSAAFVVEYSTATGYQTLTGATLSTNFMKQTGANTVTFNPIQALWTATTIGVPSVPAQKWLRLRIASGTFSTAPITDAGYAYTSTSTETDGVGEVYGFGFDPYNDLPSTTGDALRTISINKPIGFQFSYIDPTVPDPVTLTYSSTGTGTMVDLTPFIVSDTSEGFTVGNEVNYQKSTFLSTGASAIAYTVEGIEFDGYVEALPPVAGASSNHFSVFLADSYSGSPSFQLISTYASGAPVYQVFADGVQVGANHTGLDTNVPISIWRKNGQIWFNVDTVNLTALDDTGAILFAGVTSQYTANTITDFQFVDWTNRAAFPLDLTITEDTNFTHSLQTADDYNYPAAYYIYFTPPTNFTPVLAANNPFGFTGYMVNFTYGTTGFTNPTMLIENIMSVDDSSNEYYHTGSQTSLGQFGFTFTSTDVDLEDSSYMLLVKYNGGTAAHLIEVEEYDALTKTFYERLPAAQSMTDIIVIQTADTLELEVGYGAEIQLAS